MSNDEVLAKAIEYVGFWKKQLRLEDWDVTVTVPAHDPGGYARISHHQCYQHARMTIRHPEMLPPDAYANNDLEVTVVHELLHLRFANVQFPKDGPEDIAHELGIERTAEALVAMSRGEKRS